jgi:hypothetical protein
LSCGFRRTGEASKLCHIIETYDLLPFHINQLNILAITGVQNYNQVQMKMAAGYVKEKGVFQDF